MKYYPCKGYLTFQGDFNMKNSRKYNTLDGLRTIACFGIIMMHMNANNKQYEIPGFIYNSMIPSLTNFVFLFMILSAFGICCGYYEKVFTNCFDPTEFYKRRYAKILPFFSFLVLLDLLISFSKNSVYEAIADVTLTFGLFPNDIQVIGVGWFLGVIFAFYMIFPFYCVLIATKKRAWIFLGISLILNYVCISYFGVGRENIVYSFCFFMAGGLVYLYRDHIQKIRWYVSVPLLLASIILFYCVGGNAFTYLFVNGMFVILALGECGSFLENKFTHFISEISLEMYLSHMVIFRAIEKLRLNTRFGNGLLQYVVTVLLVIGLDIIFAFAANRVINFCMTHCDKGKNLGEGK